MTEPNVVDAPEVKKKSLKDLDNEEMAASIVLAKAVSGEAGKGGRMFVWCGLCS